MSVSLMIFFVLKCSGKSAFLSLPSISHISCLLCSMKCHSIYEVFLGSHVKVLAFPMLSCCQKRYRVGSPYTLPYLSARLRLKPNLTRANCLCNDLAEIFSRRFCLNCVSLLSVTEDFAAQLTSNTSCKVKVSVQWCHSFVTNQRFFSPR